MDNSIIGPSLKEIGCNLIKKKLYPQNNLVLNMPLIILNEKYL